MGYFVPFLGQTTTTMEYRKFLPPLCIERPTEGVFLTIFLTASEVTTEGGIEMRLLLLLLPVLLLFCNDDSAQKTTVMPSQMVKTI